MRKAIKLAAHNQHIAAASAKLQQQQSKLQHLLKDARAEVAPDLVLCACKSASQSTTEVV